MAVATAPEFVSFVMDLIVRSRDPVSDDGSIAPGEETEVRVVEPDDDDPGRLVVRLKNGQEFEIVMTEVK